MILFPHAKINLGLFVTNKRPDGYHNIVSVFYPIPIKDVLEILPAKKNQIRYSGIEIPGNSSDNLVYRTWQLLSEKYDLAPVYIHLRKNIPMGAGLGGGSSDAAFLIRGLNELFDLRLSVKEMMTMTAELGSDCSFFIEDKPKIATGRGEVLGSTNLDLSGYYLKLVHSDIHISTTKAYSQVQLVNCSPTELQEILKGPLTDWKNNLINSFEYSAFQLYPQLSKSKTELYNEGALYASMTGSGSTVIGIFDKEPLCKNAQEKVIRL